MSRRGDCPILAAEARLDSSLAELLWCTRKAGFLNKRVG